MPIIIIINKKKIVSVKMDCGLISLAFIHSFIDVPEAIRTLVAILRWQYAPKDFKAFLIAFAKTC